jgi:hypothetical protein
LGFVEVYDVDEKFVFFAGERTRVASDSAFEGHRRSKFIKISIEEIRSQMILLKRNVCDKISIVKYQNLWLNSGCGEIIIPLSATVDEVV